MCIDRGELKEKLIVRAGVDVFFLFFSNKKKKKQESGEGGE